MVPGDSKKVKVKKEEFSDWRTELDEGAAWTKKAGKSESGGLNEKGRKSYERENPGSDLKAPSKKVGNKRRASFCGARQVQSLVPSHVLGEGFDVIGIDSPASWVKNRIHTHLQQDLHRFPVESFHGTGKRRDEFVPVDRFDDVRPSGNGRHLVAL